MITGRSVGLRMPDKAVQKSLLRVLEEEIAMHDLHAAQSVGGLKCHMCTTKQTLL